MDDSRSSKPLTKLCDSRVKILAKSTSEEMIEEKDSALSEVLERFLRLFRKFTLTFRFHSLNYYSSAQRHSLEYYFEIRRPKVIFRFDVSTQFDKERSKIPTVEWGGLVLCNAEVTQQQ